MEPRRIVVGTSPANLPPNSAAPLVGVCFWSKGWDEWCTIIIKAVVRHDDPTLRRPETMYAHPAQTDPFERPVDFVPAKSNVDVLLVGAVDLTLPEDRRATVSGEIRAGDKTSHFDVDGAEPLETPLPLKRAKLRGGEGLDAMLGPSNFYDLAAGDFQHEESFSFGNCLTASTPLVRESIAPGSIVSVSLTAQDKNLFEAKYAIPNLTPRILLSPAKPGQGESRVRAELDTVLIDFTKKEMELTWRAVIRASGPRQIDRILIGYAETNDVHDKSSWKPVLRELPRGQFDHVWFWADAEKGVPPRALTQSEDSVARYASWRYPLAPEPRLEPDAYAEIGLELAERKEPRRDILARHKLDEQSFALEERGYLERITAETRTGISETSQRLIRERVAATARLRERRLAQLKESK